MLRSIILFISLTVLGFAQDIQGSPDKGLTYYKYIFKEQLGYDGSVFTSKYTADVWEKLFKDDAKGFKKEFKGISKKLDKFLESEKFKQIAPHLEAFAVHYSSDSGYSPHCGNDDIDEE